jgi:hypothetical protein
MIRVSVHGGRIDMGLLNKEEWLEFERLCDVEGITTGERVRIVHDVFGVTEARLYEERRCKVVTFGREEIHVELTKR